MDGNSSNHPDTPNLVTENGKVHLQSKVHNSVDYLLPRQGKQVSFSASSNSMELNSLKYSNSHQSKKVLSSISSNSIEQSSSKYSDTHQDKQVFSRVPLKWTVEHSFVKYLDSYEETCSSFGGFIDIENPYYENDCTPPEMEDSDFILGYSVDPYSEVRRTTPNIEDWDIDSNYDVDTAYEESDLPSEEYWVDNSNYDVDPHYEENDSPPEDDWGCNFNNDVHPYYEENESPATSKQVFSSVPLKWTVEHSFVKYLDSYEETCSSVGYFIDIESPYYENDCTPPEMEDSDFILGISVDPYDKEYDTISEDDWDFYSNCGEENDSPQENDWRFNSNCDEEKDTPQENDWRFNSNCDEEKDTPQENDWRFNSNCDEEKDKPQENDLRFNSNCDEGNDTSQENDRSFNSNCDADPHSEVNEYSTVKNEHSLLLRFYEELVDDLMKTFSIGYFEVCASLQHIIRNHGGVVKGQLPSENDYCDKSYCLGYLHRYAACHSIMISDSISTIFRSSPSNVLTKKLNKGKLNVIFLGGGPGNDSVGFLNALYSYRDYLLDLDVTVVDKMSGWGEVFNETIQKLKRTEYGKVYHVFNDVNITTSFISADLKNCYEWNTDMQNKLKEVDLVFLVKVLSHIPNDDKLGVLQNIILYTKPGTLLIYVDHPYPKKEFASVSRSLRPVYKSSKKVYKLKATKLKFGYRNITRCIAEMRVFERQYL